MMEFSKHVRPLVILQAIAFLFLLQVSSAVAQQKTGGDGDWTEVTRKSMPAVVSIQIYDAEGNLRGGGSGFIVQAEGVIVTNHHVVRAGSKLVVLTKDGAKFDVKGVIAYDILKDFAIIRIPAVDLPVSSPGYKRQSN